MWSEFVLAVFLASLFLFVPGYPFFRGVGFSRILSIAAAPIYTSAAYAVTCIAYGFAAISCTWASVLVPALAVAMVVFVVSRLLMGLRDSVGFPDSGPSEVEKTKQDTGADSSSSRRRKTRSDGVSDWLCLCLYLAVGVAAGCIVFLYNLPDAASYNQLYDNVNHLGMLQSFAGSDYWSSFGSSYYQMPGDEPLAAATKGGFYPSAWHDIGAMVASCSNINVAVIENAVNFVFYALVFPAGMFALMRWIFAKRVAVVWMGGIFVMAAGAFPWRFMTFGPLFPNLASMSVMPMVALAFVAAFSSEMRRRARVAVFFVFLAGCIAVALLQPNTIFALAVFLCPYCVARVYSATMRKFSGKPYSRVVALAFCLLFVLFAVTAWLFVLNLPAMASVVNYSWAPYTGMRRALLDAAVMRYPGERPQILFALMAISGVIYSLAHRKYLWLSVSYVLFSLAFAVSAGSDGMLKHIVSGFWYTDYNRVAACAAVCAMPLAAMGATWIAESAATLVLRVRGSGSAKGNRTVTKAFCATVGVLIAAGLYGPAVLFDAGVSNDAALAMVARDLKDCYDNDNTGTFDKPEQEFVEEVMDIVPAGTAIVNIPYDGSVFAFGSMGTDVYFRSFAESSNEEIGEGAIIRDRLQNVASDEEVANALKETGAEYLMLLDSDPQFGHTVYPHEAYGPMWSHLTAIDENTPGFELVLSEGDMKLFRILPATE